LSYLTSVVFQGIKAVISLNES